MSTLRTSPIRLAHANPELRPHLLPLIAEGRTAAKKLSPFAKAYFKLWREKGGMGDESDIDDMEEAYENGEVTDSELLANAPKAWKSKLPAIKNASMSEADVYSPPMDINTQKGMRAWLAIMRLYTLDSVPESPERQRRIDESRKSLSYAGFLMRKRPIGKLYEAAAKQTADWLHTVAD